MVARGLTLPSLSPANVVGLQSDKSRDIHTASAPSLPPISPQKKAKRIPLVEMAEHGDFRAVSAVLADLETRLSPRAFASKASTSEALHAAVRSGRLQIVDYMLKKGFNPNLRNKAGQTPLHIAVDLVRQGNSVASYQMARLGRDDILPRLLEARADTNVRDGKGSTPLDAAVKYSNEQTVELLVEAGAMPTKNTGKPSNRNLARKIQRLEKVAKAQQPTLDNRSAPSKLTRFCQAHSADLRALFRLFAEGAESSLTGEDDGGWNLQVVSAEGNFATVKARIAGINFYLSCQIKPLSVTNEFGMTVFQDEM
jgi:hypothetical protein